MRTRVVPPEVLAAASGLLAPFYQGLSPTDLHEALSGLNRADSSPVRPMLTKDQAARLLGLSPFTVIRMARAGKLPATRPNGGPWRFPADAVHRLARGEG